MSDYNAVSRARHAVEFTQSQFGIHYIARLETAKARHLKTAMDTELADSYRAHAATKAATVQSELDYFTNSQLVLSDPTFLSRLQEKLSGKESPKPIV